MDVFTVEKRSQIMALVRSAGNRSTEERLRLLFKIEGIKGWRRGFNLPGKPDFVFPRSRLAIFVDGCFWHGCPKCFALPKSNEEYWRPKIERNRRRDEIVVKTLREKRWRVMRIWEHEFKTAPLLRARLHRQLTKEC